MRSTSIVSQQNSMIGKYRWTICSLVFFATTINYLDRQVFSLLKPILETQFQWKESDYANIVIAFQLSYAIGMAGAGRVIDKLGTRIGYAGTLVLWSIASLLHALATGTLSFALVRSFLGLSEAGNFPAAIKTTAEWFPQRERALAAGIFNSGTNVGAILAPVIVPWLAVHYSWKFAFVATGASGLIWVIFWFVFYEVPSKQTRLSQQEYEYIHADIDEQTNSVEKSQPVKWSELLQYRQTWAFVTGKFFTDGIWWFILFWLPAFLNSQYKLVGMQVSLPIALVYTMAGFASVLGGWLPMWFEKKKGWSSARSRKAAMLIYASAPVSIIFAQALGGYNMWYAVFIIGIAASAHQAWSANLFTTVSDMFPKQLVGSVKGIGGMVGSIGGIGVAEAAGLLFDHYKALGHIQTGYTILFMFCGSGYLVAWLIIFKILVPLMPKIQLQKNEI